MFKCSPPRLDHRVRARNLRLFEDASKGAGIHEFVDGLGPVLDAAIGEKRRRTVRRHGGAASLEQDRKSVRRVEFLRDSPCENSTREVVDHGVEVRVPAIDQPDYTRVDMPNLVGRRGTNAESRFFWVGTVCGVRSLYQANHRSFFT